MRPALGPRHSHPHFVRHGADHAFQGHYSALGGERNAGTDRQGFPGRRRRDVQQRDLTPCFEWKELSPRLVRPIFSSPARVTSRLAGLFRPDLMAIIR